MTDVDRILIPPVLARLSPTNSSIGMRALALKQRLLNWGFGDSLPVFDLYTRLSLGVM